MATNILLCIAINFWFILLKHLINHDGFNILKIPDALITQIEANLLCYIIIFSVRINDQ